MMLLELLPLALLGGVLGLDVVAFPQAMISRPLVAATLTGALIGEPQRGLIMGATLELIALETLPFGASRYPEWGSASVVGGALFAMHPSQLAGDLELAVLGALATAFVGGWSMVKLRQANARWARRRESALDAGARGTVTRLQLMGMSADLLRGVVLTAIALAVLTPITTACLALWSTDAQLSRTVVIAVAASVTGGAAWKLFHATSGARWLFLGGLAAGFLVLFLR
jgi:PTS system mannose-specific IIC component